MPAYILTGTPGSGKTAAADAAVSYSRTLFFVRHRSTIERTPARQISLPEALALERVHQATCRELGLTLVDVPDATVPERVKAVEAAAMRAGK
jgi:predicted ATPase